ILIHELGHALIGRAFGLVPQIDLHGMGGTTSFGQGTARATIGTGKSVAISVAGPVAGFLLAPVVFIGQRSGLRPKPPLALHAVNLLLFANFWWGIFNLLPMLPLDGGNVMKTILSAVTKKNGEKVARIVSVIVAGSIVLLSIRSRSWW